MGLFPSDIGKRIVERGGHDDASDDDLLLLELMSRAPGMSRDDYQKCFIALRQEFGEDALHAIQNGHVKFELRPPHIEGQKLSPDT